MFFGETTKRGDAEPETMRPSEQAVVRERGKTPAADIEVGVGHANHEGAEAAQDAMRLREREARVRELLEAIPDVHAVEGLALQGALFETKSTHVEAECPRET